MKVSYEELKELTKPLVDLLVEKGHPNMTIVVNENYIKIVEDVVSTPLNDNE